MSITDLLTPSNLALIVVVLFTNFEYKQLQLYAHHNHRPLANLHKELEEEQADRDSTGLACRDGKPNYRKMMDILRDVPYGRDRKYAM